MSDTFPEREVQKTDEELLTDARKRVERLQVTCFFCIVDWFNHSFFFFLHFQVFVLYAILGMSNLSETHFLEFISEKKRWQAFFS